jgi:hypothetical protein
MSTSSNQNIDTARAYLEGMLWAAYGVRIFSDSVAEWQIDHVTECAMKLKDAENDHSALTPAEKENQKRQWKQWIDATTQGFKDKLKEEGRLVVNR